MSTRPQDLTLRNLRAVKKLIVGLEKRVEQLEAAVGKKALAVLASRKRGR